MRRIIRCRDCTLYDPVSPLLDPHAPKNAPPPDPNMGVCRAKLPNVALVPTPNGPIPVGYQVPMHRDGGCGEGELKTVKQERRWRQWLTNIGFT
jgi:hypothetical protein